MVHDNIADKAFADALLEALAYCCIGQLDEWGEVITEPVGDNTSVRISNSVFALRDECWCLGAEHGEDEDGVPLCPPNFEFYETGLTCTWHKYMGRSQEWNRDATREELIYMFLRCLERLGHTAVRAGIERLMYSGVLM